MACFLRPVRPAQAAQAAFRLLCQLIIDTLTNSHANYSNSLDTTYDLYNSSLKEFNYLVENFKQMLFNDASILF